MYTKFLCIAILPARDGVLQNFKHQTVFLTVLPAQANTGCNPNSSGKQSFGHGTVALPPFSGNNFSLLIFKRPPNLSREHIGIDLLAEQVRKS
jgi:hypothetical protein